MARMERRGVVGVLVLAVVTGVSSMLGGCGVSQKKYDAAVSENNELRSRVDQLEQQNRDQASRLSENNARDSGDNYTQPRTGGGARTARQPADDGDFHAGPGGTMVAKISGDVLFDSGSANLKPTARKTLDRIAGEIKKSYSGRGIRVEGYTDNDPIKKSKWGTNEALSQARAESVRDYLTGKGISGSRMDAVGYGSSKPKGTKAASRRVEIVITAN